ncbi:hypothetical protein AK973_3406 [Pseudomonas brassicacearum]|nr:hypothetical protein AK973_3406 [Pseudomonas brassicacearum]
MGVHRHFALAGRAAGFENQRIPDFIGQYSPGIQVMAAFPVFIYIDNRPLSEVASLDGQVA